MTPPFYQHLLPLLPLAPPCSPLLFGRGPNPLLLLFPHVTPSYPCYPLVPLLPLVTACYPLLPLVTACYPLLPFVTS